MSDRPANPWRRYRSAHLHAWRTLMPHSSAVSFKVLRWASSSRARPRRVSPAGAVVERCQRSISAWSSGVRTMLRADFRPRMATPRIHEAEREGITRWPQGSSPSRRLVNSEPFLGGGVLRVPPPVWLAQRRDLSFSQPTWALQQPRCRRKGCLAIFLDTYRRWKSAHFIVDNRPQ